MDRKKLAELVEPILESRHLELDRLETVPAGKRTVLRIVVDGDGANGRGPTLDEIAEATRHISSALDTSEAAGKQSFTLEVTTRGLNRPLTEPKHFRRNMDRLVKVSCGEETFVGRIRQTDENSVSLEIAGQLRQVRYDEITKALIQVEMNRKDTRDIEED